jgi:hypothetical protein
MMYRFLYPDHPEQKKYYLPSPDSEGKALLCVPSFVEYFHEELASSASTSVVFAL